MEAFKINSAAALYFCASWLVGLMILMAYLAGAVNEVVVFLLFIMILNIIVNAILIIVLLCYYYFFPENKIEFRNSAVLLLFNFPDIFFLYFIISII